MATSKKMSITITVMPHTATTIMVQPLVMDMTSTLRTMLGVIIILTFHVVVTRIPVLIVPVLCGPATTISALMRLRFTMKCSLKVQSIVTLILIHSVPASIT